jgi:hypothetical protein
VTDRHSNAGPTPFSPEPDCLSADVILFYGVTTSLVFYGVTTSLDRSTSLSELTNILECDRPHLDLIRLNCKAVSWKRRRPAPPLRATWCTAASSCAVLQVIKLFASFEGCNPGLDCRQMGMRPRTLRDPKWKKNILAD